jgi:hypothetical protein
MPNDAVQPARRGIHQIHAVEMLEGVLDLVGQVPGRVS